MSIRTSLTQEESLLKAHCAGEELAKLGLTPAQIKEKVEHAVEDGIKAARRATVNGRHAAEDFLEETAHHIKREPLRSVAAGFGAGIGLGALLGWLATRNGRHT